MNYLVWRASGADGAHGSLSTRILQSNPILEGLGNAKTVRNNNSSRFGKYVTMRFDEKNMLQGAEVQTFLLEKSRVVATTAKGERNYHVFYHVLLGSGLLPEADPMKLRQRRGLGRGDHRGDARRRGGRRRRRRPRLRRVHGRLQRGGARERGVEAAAVRAAALRV